MSKTKRIAIYGKGGIGKSTIVSNIAAAYSEDYNVLVIGCDPKSDTTRTLVGRRIPTILDIVKEKKDVSVEDVLFEGYGEVQCVESGGPEPGVGCAGRGVIVAMKLLDRLGTFSEAAEHEVFGSPKTVGFRGRENFHFLLHSKSKILKDVDIIIYDVLGDVVCGGFAVPLREGFANEVYIVTSGEYMALYAANNISKGIKKLKGNLGGIICNCRGIENEVQIVAEFAERIGSKVIGVIPRNGMVQKSEIDAKTVIEKFGESKQADLYRKLAKAVYSNEDFAVPKPMDIEEFDEFFRKFQSD